MSTPINGLVRFEGYEIDRARWQLRHGDEVLPLNRKTFDLLLYLLEHADRVVSKDELLRVIWPGAFIEEGNLTQQIFLLRKALARFEPGKKFIETTPGRGYRIAVPVHFEPPLHAQAELPASADPAPGNQAYTSSSPLPRVSRRSLAYGASWWAAAVALVLLTFWLLWRHAHSGHLSIASYTQITHDGHAKSMGGTDGSRIYYTRLEKSRLARVSVSGGKEELLQLPVQDPWCGDVSPDGSTLLMISQESGLGPASSLWSLQLAGGSLHRLGYAIASAWSPDSREIVYASAGGELFIMRRDGSDAHRIASVGGEVGFMAWSPDGRLIRFSRDGRLWEIAPDGSHLRQLLPGWGVSPTQWSGQWTPDGTFVFVADGQLWQLGYRKQLLGKEQLAPVQLTYGPTVWDRPLPSPDGKQIFASGRTRRGELVRFEPGASQPKPFLEGISAEFVTFSKDHKAVAYVSYPEGILWKANPDGSDPMALTRTPVSPKSLCWSPDGTQIAFVDHTPANLSAVFLLATDGTGQPRRLVSDDRQAETDPSWSPDGRKVAYATSPNVGASARSDLRIADLTTGKVADLPGSDGLMVPHWSPDGHAIAAMTLDSNSMRVLDLSLGRWSPLQTGAVAFPEWSHDGQWIDYVRWTAHPALVRVHVRDGKSEVLADLTGTQYTGSYTLWMGLDPEDRPMMLRDAGTDDIYALRLQRQ